MNLKYEEKEIENHRIRIIDFDGLIISIGQFDRNNDLWYAGRNSPFGIKYRKGFSTYNECLEYVKRKIITWIDGQIS